MHNFARECQSHWRKNLSPHIRYVATIPHGTLRHKSNTFHTNISTLHMFISITFTETSIDETKKHSRKSEAQNLCSKCSSFTRTHQTTTPLRNCWWFRWQCPVLVLSSCTSWNQRSSLVNGDYYRNTVVLNMLLPDIRSDSFFNKMWHMLQRVMS